MGEPVEAHRCIVCGAYTDGAYLAAAYDDDERFEQIVIVWFCEEHVEERRSYEPTS